MKVTIKIKDVFEVVDACNGDEHLAAASLFEKWNLSQDENLSQRNVLRSIRRIKKPKTKIDSDEYKGFLESSFLELEIENPAFQELTAGGDAHYKGRRPAKTLGDNPHKRTQRNILDKPITDLINFAEEQGVSLEHLLELITARVQSKKQKAKVIIPEDEAVAFYFNEGFSSRSWTELRVFLLQFDVELPTRNMIDSKKQNLAPTMISHEIKCSVTYPDLIKDTVDGLISAENCQDSIPNDAVLELTAKTGIDGSGCHKVRHQVVNSDLSFDENPHLDPSISSNYILCCVAPLFLHMKTNSDKVLLWKNPLPNSISYTRPLSLVRAAESREVIENEFESLFSSINTNEHFAIKLDGKTVTVQVNNTVSMIDGKMVGILQGDTGNTKCHYCTCSTTEMNNIVLIQQGFIINKDYTSCTEAWKLIEKGIEWNDKDRQGQCVKPLVPINFFAILHWKLRSFDYALNILYRLVAGVYVWGKAGHNNDFKAAKTHVQENLRQQLGILVDVPTPGGGNTNSGSIAQRFFSSDSRDTICELITCDINRQNYNIFLQHVNVMLSICLGMKSGVDIHKTRQFGIDIMSHIRTSFVNSEGLPWIPVNPSLHAMCSHAWQLFDMAAGQPIAVFSEQAQEHWNKNVLSYKSGGGARARQHSVRLNIRDIMARMLHMTHPVVVAKQRRIKCSVCHEYGHTARSKQKHGQQQLLKEDDILINSLFNDL